MRSSSLRAKPQCSGDHWCFEHLRLYLVGHQKLRYYSHRILRTPGVLMDSIRGTLVQTLIMLLTLFGLNLVFTRNQVRADRAACEQIRTACQNAGFVLSGGARNGLLLDCFQPIVRGTAQPKSASRPLPAITANGKDRQRRAILTAGSIIYSVSLRIARLALSPVSN